MSKFFDNIDLRSKIPLDKRTQTDVITNIELPYEGMRTYQTSDNNWYNYKNGKYLIEFKNELNLKDFGAKGDGITDDTQALQNAINSLDDYYNILRIPKGIYLIDGTTNPEPVSNYAIGGIRLKSNIKIIFETQARLKTKATSQKYYCILKGVNIENVIIENATIEGDRLYHLDTTGEWGYGIGLFGCINIQLNNCYCYNLWGDGFNISAYNHLDNETVSKNIKMYKCVSDNNRRQGLSVSGVDGLLIEESEFKNTNGTAPQSGIDLEPDSTITTNNNVKILKCLISGNAKTGLLCDTHDSFNTIVEKCIIKDNLDRGVWFKGKGYNVFRDCTIYGGMIHMYNSIIDNCDIYMTIINNFDNYCIEMAGDYFTKILNSRIHASGGRRLIWCTGSNSESTRKKLINCDFILEDDLNSISSIASIKDYSSVIDSRFIYTGNTTSKLFSVDTNFDGVKTKIINTHFDNIFSYFYNFKNNVNMNVFKGWLSAPPNNGSFSEGDIIYNSSPSTNRNVGWVYVNDTDKWTPFGSLDTLILENINIDGGLF